METIIYGFLALGYDEERIIIYDPSEKDFVQDITGAEPKGEEIGVYTITWDAFLNLLDNGPIHTLSIFELPRSSQDVQEMQIPRRGGGSGGDIAFLSTTFLSPPTGLRIIP